MKYKMQTISRKGPSISADESLITLAEFLWFFFSVFSQVDFEPAYKVKLYNIGIHPCISSQVCVSDKTSDQYSMRKSCYNQCTCVISPQNVSSVGFVLFLEFFFVTVSRFLQLIFNINQSEKYFINACMSKVYSLYVLSES